MLRKFYVLFLVLCFLLGCTFSVSVFVRSVTSSTLFPFCANTEENFVFIFQTKTVTLVESLVPFFTCYSTNHFYPGLNSGSIKFRVPVFSLNIYESDSFKPFCKCFDINFTNFKVTFIPIRPDLLHTHLSNLYSKQDRSYGWMEGHGCLDHGGFPCLSLAIMLIRIFRIASSPGSAPDCQSHWPRCIRRKVTRLKKIWKPAFNYLPYIYLLLLLGGDIHPNPGPIFPMHRRHPNSESIIVGAWNVRTLLEKKRSHMRPTAVVARLLKECKIDICALSETRLHGENQIQEVGAGYTFFLNGRPADNPPQIHGVGFAIRADLVT